MRVLQSWLQEYVPFRIPPQELAERLTMLGLEFESVELLGEKYRGFVVGEVVEKIKHPQADRLSVCMVNVGGETLQVVCGAPNVAPGQKVAVGCVGATVPRNQHDPAGKPLVLSRVKIRGVESSGMICSEFELDLGKDAAGILVLDGHARVGQPLSAFLGLDDVAFDVEITPNRPDWLSHVGVAREIGVLVGKHVALPKTKLREGKEPIRRSLSVEVKDRENCLRFAARMIRGVRIGPSPKWMQDRLRNAGLRPRNNAVDVTNYVMLECGHPLHAFDYSLIQGGSIIVRQAPPGTPFTTLDGKRHTLPAGAVMVCDRDREISVAGIMGGANSEIAESTADVVIESACWNPSSIRRTARSLGISSDASQRFERGADPNVVLFALNRAAALLLELAGGTLLKGVIDVYPKKVRERRIPLRPARVNKVLGTSLKPRQIAKCLEALDIVEEGRKGPAITFKVPTFRVDIEREIDLVEEVARVFGYDRIEAKTRAMVDFSLLFPVSGLPERVRETLIGMGYQESITNSMQEERSAALSGNPAVRILNPQNQEMAMLRTSLLPGLLGALAINQSRGNSDLRLFEIGHVFRLASGPGADRIGRVQEESRVCFVMAGQAMPRHWGVPSRPADFYDLRGDVEGFLGKFALDKRQFISYRTSDGLTDNALAIEINGGYAGYFGEVRSDILKRMGVDGGVLVAELMLTSLSLVKAKAYRELPKYPRVRRDVAFIVDENVNAGAVEEVIRSASNELLQSVEVFDVFTGKTLPAGKKSLAFSLELMSRERTLTDEEIESAVQRIVEGVEKGLSASLRGVH